MPPKVLAKPKSDRSSAPAGVLPVPASARASQPKQQNAARLKLEVRRLPPGLTLTEFEEALGSEWRLGAGKVDWREFRHGKLRKNNKLPEMGRCYVHVTNENLVRDFEQVFLNTKFEDRAGTHKDRDIRAMGWLPVLGFATNQRVPNIGRIKPDQRQGTIDQDAEFMAFLEGETQVVAKPSAIDNVMEKDAEKKAVRSTPLIDDLREKKAKAEAKKKEGKDGSGGKGKHAKSDSRDVSGDKEGKSTKGQKSDRAAKDGAKSSHKQAPSKQVQTQTAVTAQSSSQPHPQQQQQQQGKTSSPAKSKKKQSGTANAATQATKETPATPSPASVKPTNSEGPTSGRETTRGGRQRGNAEGIKKMLQKDLGIRPKTTQAAGATPSQSDATTPPTTRKAGGATPASKTPAPSKAAAAAAPGSPAPSGTSAPTSASKASATKAYLKHANPTQGITEILLRNTLSAQFGPVVNVTIDPRKGTAVAVFQDSESLKKAIEAKKVPVAGGVVEVTEFKERGGPTGRGPRGGRGSARGGGGDGGGGSGAGERGGGGGRSGNAAADGGGKTGGTASTTATSPAVGT